MTKIFIALLFTTLSPLASSAAPAKDDPNIWDLTQIYPDEAAWKAAIQKLDHDLPQLAPCKGQLGSSAETLKKCLDTLSEMRIRLGRISTWASLKKSGDVRSSTNQQNEALATDVGARFSQATSYFAPELSRLGRDKIDAMLAANKDLGLYRQYLREIVDHAEHFLDPQEEQLLAAFGPVIGHGSDIQSLLLSSDIPWPSVKLASGKSEKIDQAGYLRLRESQNRADRKVVFASFFNTLKSYQNTMGASLSNAVKAHTIDAKVRKYKSALEAALDGDKIPEQVYRTLVQKVHEGLPVLHRYLRLQAKAMGVKDLAYYDVAVVTAKLDRKFPIEESKKTVLEAVKPLGPDYQAKLAKAFNEHWSDVFPREGKVSGAFMDPGAYGVHPYVLLNHQNNYESMSTIAHEFGHAMHSVYSSEAQPFIYTNYATFIAEIASITNEILLIEHMIKNAKNPNEKIFYNEQLMTLVRATYFRQTQFAEFELAIHEEIEKGEALTGQKLSEMYGKLVRQYYGHDQGVMRVDEIYFPEWAYVPHFYYNFYVYQYATSITAAFYFADSILSGKPGAVENYLKVLKSGSAKYPYEILKDAGVDMAQPAVHDALLKRAERAVNDLEGLRGK